MGRDGDRWLVHRQRETYRQDETNGEGWLVPDVRKFSSRGVVLTAPCRCVCDLPKANVIRMG